MQVLSNVSLQPYNTFGLDTPARYFTAFERLDQLQEALQWPAAQGLPTLVLGGGSNILLTKAFDGLVLKNELKGISVVKEDDEFVYIKAGAGEQWHGFVLHSIAQGLGGLENLSLIPGNVGASPMQNIGAYGVEIKDVFDSLEAWHLQDKTVVTFHHADCAFGYRESVFKQAYKGQFVILSVTFKLRKHPQFHTSYGAINTELEQMGVTELSVQAISQAVINIRSSKLPDPKKIGNAGSFFKNPTVSEMHYKVLKGSFPEVVAYPAGQNAYKLAAGWLIEQCGWKGYREGDAGVHEKQALVLVNYGKASGQDIYRLSTKILQSVQLRFGVLLEREVNII
ncbi:UDP-N-acetylmuramate dehydrogenase [Chitinophaga costaii]|uniref:UDP-N-acetylenolpyruvoylglucosamine reductase n=1 Tax=Chitinophaga costaii TaxID=1335309 RepID=A0A1C4D9P6_9BACT|nr:UDP-N-acetylmuramate dehydrogenase [Chitinophaga costaii]PUZ24524.1 UDP-N-acetylmuramate dehydrogenase [Chitinophaga costaii]SCC28124.1 UDP-N-acetylmuramate dehydrogenase [Chitinophaga costaii]